MKKILLVLICLTLLGCNINYDPYDYNFESKVMIEKNIVYQQNDIIIYKYTDKDRITYYDQNMNIIDKYIVYSLQHTCC